MVSIICFFLFNRLKWLKILSLALCIRGCTNVHQWGEQHYQATVYQVNTLINWSLIIWSLYKVEHLGHFICERKELYRVDWELTIIQCGLACLIFLMLHFYFHGWAFRESNCYFNWSLVSFMLTKSEVGLILQCWPTNTSTRVKGAWELIVKRLLSSFFTMWVLSFPRQSSCSDKSMWLTMYLMNLFW